VKIGDLVVGRNRVGTNRMGIVVLVDPVLDYAPDRANIKVQWPPEYCGEPLWAKPSQLEVISASR
jgi:hypothetical protein